MSNVSILLENFCMDNRLERYASPRYSDFILPDSLLNNERILCMSFRRWLRTVGSRFDFVTALYYYETGNDYLFGITGEALYCNYGGELVLQELRLPEIVFCRMLVALLDDTTFIAEIKHQWRHIDNNYSD